MSWSRSFRGVCYFIFLLSSVRSCIAVLMNVRTECLPTPTSHFALILKTNTSSTSRQRI